MQNNEEFIKNAFAQGLSEDQVRQAVSERNKAVTGDKPLSAGFDWGQYIKNTGRNAVNIGKGFISAADMNRRMSPGNLVTNPQDFGEAWKEVGTGTKNIVSGAVNTISNVIKNPPTADQIPDLAKKAIRGVGNWAYENPIDATAIVAAPATEAIMKNTVGLPSEVLGGIKDRVGTALDLKLHPIENVEPMTIPAIKEQAKTIGRDAKNWMARGVIKPKLSGEFVGDIGKEETVGRNILDITKSKSPYGIAKDIEELYPKVNEKLGQIVKSKSAEVGPIPVLENGKKPFLEEVVAKAAKDPVAKMYPDLMDRVRIELENKLLPAGINPNAVSTFTDLNKINEARQTINADSAKWFKAGSPMTDDVGRFNHLMGLVNESLSEKIASLAPEAKELVSVQSNLIPAWKGLYPNLGKDVIGSSKTNTVIKMVNAILDPLQVEITRNPNSDFARRLKILLESEVAPLVQKEAVSSGQLLPEWAKVPVLTEEELRNAPAVIKGEGVKPLFKARKGLNGKPIK